MLSLRGFGGAGRLLGRRSLAVGAAAGPNQGRAMAEMGAVPKLVVFDCDMCLW